MQHVSPQISLKSHSYCHFWTTTRLPSEDKTTYVNERGLETTCSIGRQIKRRREPGWGYARQVLYSFLSSAVRYVPVKEASSFRTNAYFRLET